MIQHNAFFKWQPTITPAVEAAAFAALRALKDQVPGIVSLTIGHQNSPEGLGKGFQVGLSVVFTDAAARDGYLKHPAHTKAVETFLPQVADIVVLDYTF